MCTHKRGRSLQKEQKRGEREVKQEKKRDYKRCCFAAGGSVGKPPAGWRGHGWIKDLRRAVVVVVVVPTLR